MQRPLRHPYGVNFIRIECELMRELNFEQDHARHAMTQQRLVRQYRWAAPDFKDSKDPKDPKDPKGVKRVSWSK